MRWIERFLRFHRDKAGRWTHPEKMDAADVESFLTYLAVRRHVSASTQNQALNALVFLFQDVLKRELGKLDAVRARRKIGGHITYLPSFRFRPSRRFARPRLRDMPRGQRRDDSGRSSIMDGVT